MKFLSLCTCALLLGGCTTAIRNDMPDRPDEVLRAASRPTSKTAAPQGNDHLVVQQQEDIIGYWVGMFEPDTTAGEVTAGEGFSWTYENKINISIDKISDGKVWGHSVVAGNNRPFEGTVATTGTGFSFSVKEPGNNKYDGAFQFAIDKDDTLLNGTWRAYQKLKISVRRYSLQKMMFHYDPEVTMDYRRYVDWNKKGKHFTNWRRGEEGDYDDAYFTTTDDIGQFNASQRLLTGKEVSNLKKGDLFIIRNAIYARHGYSFKNQQLRVYFDRQPWYIPVSTNVTGEFTSIEKTNIDLLLRYEKNAKEYYDVFGRG